MDAGWFLKERTRFTRYFYDEAVQPFESTKRRIEDGLPPFAEPQDFDPDEDSAEPSFQLEWSDASTAAQMVGQACTSILSDSLKVYFETLKRVVIRFDISFAPGEPNSFRRDGFVPAYRQVLGEILDTDWSNCPADFAVIEQIVLARNRASHGRTLTTLHIRHGRDTLSKFPTPFFTSEEEAGAWAEEEGWRSDLLSPSLTISRDKLFAAMDHIDLLADWIDGRDDQVRAWRHRARRAPVEQD